MDFATSVEVTAMEFAQDALKAQMCRGGWIPVDSAFAPADLLPSKVKILRDFHRLLIPEIQKTPARKTRGTKTAPGGNVNNAIEAAAVLDSLREAAARAELAGILKSLRDENKEFGRQVEKVRDQIDSLTQQ